MTVGHSQSSDPSKSPTDPDDPRDPHSPTDPTKPGTAVKATDNTDMLENILAQQRLLLQLIQQLQTDVNELKKTGSKNTWSKSSVISYRRCCFPRVWKPDSKEMTVDEARFMKDTIDYKRAWCIKVAASIAGLVLAVIQYCGGLDIARIWTKR